MTERRDGTKRLYRARPETIAQLWASLEVFWSESLRTLKEAAEREEPAAATFLPGPARTEIFSSAFVRSAVLPSGARTVTASGGGASNNSCS